MKDLKVKPLRFLLIFTFVLLIFYPQYILASENDFSDSSRKDEVPPAVLNGLNHLLTVVQQNEAIFDGSQVGPLLDFAVADGNHYKNVKPQKRESGKGVFMQVDVNAPLKRILQYIYNPEIPNYIVFPSVLRLCGWHPGSEFVTSGVKLWNEMDDLKSPLIFRGKEFEVNTPDSFGGAYYRYVNKRLIIAMKHRKGRVLISTSKMLSKSNVGRKAVIIDDRNWNYFYSGINGLNVSIIGAMNTYMYDAESVIIYYQPDLGSSRTIVALFKWLRAGWAGINVVKPDHIYDGCIRFARGIKRVTESDTLPEPGQFVKQVNYINSLPDDQIDAKIREYARNFERIAKSHKDMDKKDYARIIANGGYADVLDREERIGVLILEMLKHQIGKPALVKFKLPEMRGKLQAFKRPDTEISLRRD